MSNYPEWFSECSLMEQFGWTEKELYEHNSMTRIRYISAYNRIKNEAEKRERERSDIQSRSKPGAIVNRIA